MNRDIETITSNEDYLEYYGVDLNKILTGLVINSTGDKPAPRFIYRVENWCKTKLMLPPYGWDGNTAKLTAYQRELFIKGVVQQISYDIDNDVLSNTTITEQNVIIPQGELERIGWNPNAFDCFRLAGLANLMRW